MRFSRFHCRKFGIIKSEQIEQDKSSISYRNSRISLGRSNKHIRNRTHTQRPSCGSRKLQPERKNERDNGGQKRTTEVVQLANLV